jgi:hypothetical protein
MIAACAILIVVALSIAFLDGPSKSTNQGAAVTNTSTASTSSAEIPPTSVEPVPPSTAPPTFSGSKYLTDLSPSIGSSVQTGFAKIVGKDYKHSFIAQLCFGDSQGTVTVNVPPGVKNLKGVVGYEDGSFAKEDTGSNRPLNGMRVESTTDAPGLDDEAKQWVRLDELSLTGGGHAVTPFTETLPEGTTTVRLRPDGYACSTTVAWGDPLIS